MGGFRRLASGYIPRRKLFLEGNLNEHVKSITNFEGVHGGYGLGKVNVKGQSILEFSSTLDLTIRDKHLITYKSQVIHYNK